MLNKLYNTIQIYIYDNYLNLQDFAKLEICINNKNYFKNIYSHLQLNIESVQIANDNLKSNIIIWLNKRYFENIIIMCDDLSLFFSQKTRFKKTQEIIYNNDVYIYDYDYNLTHFNLSYFENLRFVNLRCNNIQNINFHGCVKLNKINLYGTDFHSINILECEELCEIKLFFGRLKEFKCSNLNKLTNLSIQTILKYDNNSNEIINSVLKKCENLIKFSLLDINGLSDFINYLNLNHLSKLQEFSSNMCYRLVDLDCCNNLLQITVFKCIIKINLNNYVYENEGFYYTTITDMITFKKNSAWNILTQKYDIFYTTSLNNDLCYKKIIF